MFLKVFCLHIMVSNFVLLGDFCPYQCMCLHLHVHLHLHVFLLFFLCLCLLLLVLSYSGLFLFYLILLFFSISRCLLSDKRNQERFRFEWIGRWEGAWRNWEGNHNQNVLHEEESIFNEETENKINFKIMQLTKTCRLQWSCNLIKQTRPKQNKTKKQVSGLPGSYN